MKKIVTTFVLMFAFVGTAFAANSVRISQVYGGGGGSGFYKYDYVELFNASGSAVNIGGWSIQYGSSGGTAFGSTATNMAIIPAGASIAPCSYYLIQVGSAGTAGTDLPVTADLVNSAGPSMSQSAGKLALVNNSIGNNLCSGNSVGGIYVDVASWGAANCFEGAAGPGTTNQSAIVRLNGGLTDTDNNANDFVVVTGPIPHNSASPANTACLATPVTSSTWGAIKGIYR